MATVRIEKPRPNQSPDQALYSLEVATEGALEKIVEAFATATATGRREFTASYTEHGLTVTILVKDNRPRPLAGEEDEDDA